jgi:hypothetical protein
MNIVSALEVLKPYTLGTGEFIFKSRCSLTRTLIIVVHISTDRQVVSKQESQIQLDCVYRVQASWEEKAMKFM